jgi:hypothetical protein
MSKEKRRRKELKYDNCEQKKKLELYFFLYIYIYSFLAHLLGLHNNAIITTIMIITTIKIFFFIKKKQLMLRFHFLVHLLIFSILHINCILTYIQFSATDRYKMHI